MFEVAHLAAVELLSPKRAQTVAFFTELLGMYVVRSDERSTYLRGYEDPYAYSLKVTAAPRAGTGFTAFRTHSQQALERRAKVLEAKGLGDGWLDGDFGHGAAYRFHTPDGHPMKLLWDVDYADVAEENRTALKNRPSKRPTQGVPVRRLDHINLLCSDVTVNKDAFQQHLGFHLSEHIVADDGVEMAAWLRVTQLAHDVAFSKDPTGSRGRLHHVAFWYGIPQHLMDVAELCIQNDIVVEAGPGKHGISQGLFLYVIEPGGNRVELFGDSGYLIFDPTWKPVRWDPSELEKGIIWIGSDLPKEFFLYGTPTVGSEAEAAEGHPSHVDDRLDTVATEERELASRP